MIDLEDTPEERWFNNELQFARLLSELNAAGAWTEETLEAVRCSMDLSVEDLERLRSRAERVWTDSLETLEANGLLEEIRTYAHDAIAQSRAEYAFEKLDRHMKAGKRPPSAWVKGQVDGHDKG